MPVNKNMFGRLLVIHGKLSTGRQFTWEELAGACEFSTLVRQRPSKRSVQNDIAFLQEEFGAPIPKRQSAYFYSKPFSFLNILDIDDVSLLNETLALLSQFRELPQRYGLEEVLLKLETQGGTIGEKMSNVVFFEQVEGLRGIHYLNELYNYVRAERCLEVDYADFEKNRHTFVIHPYFLKEYNNRWYLFGLENETKAIYNLALDRIEAIRFAAVDFVPNQTIANIPVYFENLIGVTRPPGLEPSDVQLLVSKPRARYVATKPLHASQQILEETDRHILFGYHVIVNKELESKILELGVDALVMAPPELRRSMGETVRKMGEGYGL